MTKQLVLWDVDHTLIATRGVGREVFIDAFEQVTGRPLEVQARITGRSEMAIFQETLALHDLPRDLVDFSTFAEVLADGYERRRGELRERGGALPGAGAALDALAGMPSVVQTAATGNVKRVAEIKLEVFGLEQHLDLAVGAYGDDTDDRAELIALALRRAKTAARHAVIFGDTTADVEAGRANGVLTVAVATGRTSAEALADAGATHVIADLSDTATVLRLVGSLPSD